MKFKTHYLTSILLLLMFTISSCSSTQKKTNNNWFDHAIKVSEAQLEKAASTYSPDENPRSIKADGSIHLAPARDWTCGFFPGSLWYAYELTGNKELEAQANRFTLALDSVQYFTYTHDLGFMLYCSYGNAYRLTNKEEYKKVLLTGAESLATRFNPTVGCIRSWDFGEWQFPVIVDNMMNLEFLCWASDVSGDAKYKDIAKKHADKTMQNHFRPDYSSYHVVSYDTITGEAIQKRTYQGYADDSAWARGQAWGVHGYTMMYRETKNKNYLNMAQKIASFLMNHPNMPKDKVPYWDFNAPNIPDAPRDASAAAIIASAFIELSAYADANSPNYFAYAEDILQSLSSSQYLAEVGSNAYFILKHSVGALPKDSEIDTPLNYADYYYLEAMMRYKKHQASK